MREEEGEKRGERRERRQMRERGEDRERRKEGEKRLGLTLSPSHPFHRHLWD